MYFQVSFQALYSVPLVSVFMTITCSLDYIALGYNLKSGSVMLLTLFFFRRITLDILDLLQFHTNFKIIFHISLKNAIGTLMGFVLNCALGSMDILSVLIILIHKHMISSYLFVSSSISKSNYRKPTFYIILHGERLNVLP